MKKIKCPLCNGGGQIEVCNQCGSYFTEIDMGHDDYEEVCLKCFSLEEALSGTDNYNIYGFKTDVCYNCNGLKYVYKDTDDTDDTDSNEKVNEDSGNGCGLIIFIIILFIVMSILNFG